MISPAELQPHYARFRVADRLLLTGHSHQAWPDVAREAVLDAFDTAAREVDGKWGPAYEKADRVRAGWRTLLNDDASGDIALGQNTHDLLVRFLSGLDWSRRDTVLTTDAEFHTVRRQVDRLHEAGWVKVEKVDGRPVEGVCDRLVERVRGGGGDRIACVVLSSVYFATSEVVPGIEELAAACTRAGVPLLLDAYHHLGALPFDLHVLGLGGHFVMGGGYKYLQLGEGNCFLRFPADTAMRPVFTGWFAEFAELAEAKSPGEVRYGTGPARFMGATWDPVSHWRGAAVFDFFQLHRLTPARLRELSRHQVRRLAEGIAGKMGVGDPVGSDRFPGLRRGWDGLGGFLALRTPKAAALHERLMELGVRTDFRDEMLRFGPAPYLTDAQLDAATEAVGRAVDQVGV